MCYKLHSLSLLLMKHIQIEIDLVVFIWLMWFNMKRWYKGEVWIHLYTALSVIQKYVVIRLFIYIITGFVTRLTRRLPLVEQELPSLSEHLSSTPGFKWGSCYSIFSFLCKFCRSLFALLSFWPLCCLSFYDLRILSTPLVSSSSSCITEIVKTRSDLQHVGGFRKGFHESLDPPWIPMENEFGLDKQVSYLRTGQAPVCHTTYKQTQYTCTSYNV